jgi:hypothetical protein
LRAAPGLSFTRITNDARRADRGGAMGALMVEQQDIPPSLIQIGDIAFGIEFIEVPDAAARWNEVIDHIGAWLLAEWEREQVECEPK